MAPPRPLSDAAGRARDPLEDDLGWRLGVAGRLIRTWADARLAGERIGVQALALHLWLEREPGLTRAGLARRRRVEAPTVRRMLDHLEREGLVERRARAGDRRALGLGLTAGGRPPRGGVRRWTPWRRRSGAASTRPSGGFSAGCRGG